VLSLLAHLMAGGAELEGLLAALDELLLGGRHPRGGEERGGG
jgi:hypothetical protein